jgi:hypothetical protein
MVAAVTIEDKEAIPPISATFGLRNKVFKPLEADLIVCPAFLARLYTLVAR